MKKINMIDISVKAEIKITFGTETNEKFSFHFFSADKQMANKFIPHLKDYLSTEGYDISGLESLAQIEIEGPVCPKCNKRLGYDFQGVCPHCGYP